MRKKVFQLLLLALMLPAMLASAQGEPAVVSLSGGSQDVLRDICRLSNGTVIVAGDTRTDAKGNLLSGTESLGLVLCLGQNGGKALGAP